MKSEVCFRNGKKFEQIKFSTMIDLIVLINTKPYGNHDQYRNSYFKIEKKKIDAKVSSRLCFIIMFYF